VRYLEFVVTASGLIHIAVVAGQVASQAPPTRTLRSAVDRVRPRLGGAVVGCLDLVWHEQGPKSTT
jgi:hypothetical protein